MRLCCLCVLHCCLSSTIWSGMFHSRLHNPLSSFRSLTCMIPPCLYSRPYDLKLKTRSLLFMSPSLLFVFFYYLFGDVSFSFTLASQLCLLTNVYDSPCPQSRPYDLKLKTGSLLFMSPSQLFVFYWLFTDVLFCLTCSRSHNPPSSFPVTLSCPSTLSFNFQLRQYLLFPPPVLLLHSLAKQ